MAVVRKGWPIPMAENKPISVAHRCGAALGPENSAIALSRSLAIGVDAVETDVRMTVDGVLVCFHDEDLTRLAGRNEKIQELTLIEIKARYSNIMTVSECLEKRQSTGVWLDIKDNRHACLEKLCDLLHNEGDLGRVVIGLRETESASIFQPDVYGYQLLALAKNPQHGGHWRSVGAEWFRLWENEAGTQTVEGLKAQGFKIAIMTGDRARGTGPFPTGRAVGEIDQKGLCALLALQPDAIMLDNPTELIRR
jgi:glycerophosphoryl diester phosphodiesterase